MINWIEYKFQAVWNDIYIYIHTIWWDWWEECIVSTEINQLSWKDVRGIIEELEKVKKWNKEYFMFWYETTTIWCYQKWKWYYWGKYPSSEVTITYNYADDYIVTELKIEQILKMMIDWGDYIEAWEKETGKIYKGI